MTPWPKLINLPPAMSGPPDAAGVQNVIKPFVHNDGHVKSLHFTMDELQSRTNLLSPYLLEVDYTRTMMGFLLFNSAPASIAMVGLGGGSLAKFCYRQLPECRMTVVEINPHVIALRREFEVPDDNARFNVVEADGAAFVGLLSAQFDVLLIDGFDHDGQPAALCSQRFYEDCFAALTPDGILAVNLHHDNEDYPVWVERIRRSFNGNAVEIITPEKSNCIVFASRGKPFSPRSLNLQASLSKLDSQARVHLKPEFSRIAWSMKSL